MKNQINSVNDIIELFEKKAETSRAREEKTLESEVK